MQHSLPQPSFSLFLCIVYEVVSEIVYKVVYEVFVLVPIPLTIGKLMYIIPQKL